MKNKKLVLIGYCRTMGLFGWCLVARTWNTRPTGPVPASSNVEERQELVRAWIWAKEVLSALTDHTVYGPVVSYHIYGGASFNM
eukprot:gene6256-4505_t